MHEKLILGFITFLIAVLGFIGKVTFVKKKEVFDRNGRPLFQYKDSCNVLHQEVKEGQQKVCQELGAIKQILARIDQKVIDHNINHQRKV